MKKIAVIIPCYNESAGIAKVIEAFPRSEIEKRGYGLEIVVVDNNSTDNTSEIAKGLGASVYLEPFQGKGHALRTGFKNLPKDAQFIAMLDGDNTYKPQEILRLIEPIDSGFCDVIVGSRISGKMGKGSMSWIGLLGNWVFSFFVRILYKVNVTDCLTGYFAWSRAAIEDLSPYLTSTGFSIEMEMVTKMARLGQKIYSVPVTYDPRAGSSSIRYFHDGVRILAIYLRSLVWRPRNTRIAFVCNSIFPYNKGGVEKRLYEITRRLVAKNQEVHVYTMKWWEGPRTIKRNGVYLHGICPRLEMYSGDRRSILQAVIFGLSTLRLLFVRFDVLDVDHMPFFPLFSAKLVCTIRRKKFYATWHEVWGTDYWKNYMGASGRIGGLIERLAIKTPHAIVSVSNHTTEKLRDFGAKQPIHTVPLGVDLVSILDAPPSDTWSDILYAGRLLSHKHIDHLIRAVALARRTNPHIRCTIVGEGPEKENLMALVKKLRLGHNVQLIDFVKEDADLYGLMKTSRMFVLPSTREGFGLVVVEANACGIPVITTTHQDNAARALIVEGQNGYLVEPNYRLLAKKILEIVNDGARPVFSDEVIKSTHSYDWNDVAKRIEKVLVAR
jgi:glycosyltransferase involved in cell wall biosynthesis